MINEVDSSYIFNEQVSLDGAENYILAVSDNIKVGMALIATALGRIKRDCLYYVVAPSFRAYIEQERTGIQYREALRLAKIGENYWSFQPAIRENGIKVSENMTKILLLDKTVIDHDPVFWDNFKSLSTRQLSEYIKRKKSGICAYPSKRIDGKISVSGASLYFGEEKVKGLNLNQIREQMEQGRRPVILFVENEAEARRIRKQLVG